MDKSNRFLSMLILAITVFSSGSYATPVFAIVPTVQNAVVWSSGGNTVLNVTVFHDPEISLHHVDAIEANISGVIQSFPVAVQPATTFTIPCNLGSIEGTPSATIRAHCTVHGWSSWSVPLQVPEFSLPTLLFALTLVASVVAVFVSRKIRSHPLKLTKHFSRQDK